MNTNELLTLLKNSVTALQAERATASSSGQVARVLEIEIKILETQTTIEQLEGVQPE
jgi:hypothetical protein